jgi:hypothetical protein
MSKLNIDNLKKGIAGSSEPFPRNIGRQVRWFLNGWRIPKSPRVSILKTVENFDGLELPPFWEPPYSFLT